MQDIRSYRLWEREHCSGPAELLKQVGVLGLAERIDGVPQLLDEWIDKITNGQSPIDAEHRIGKAQSKQQQRQARDAKIVELRAVGLTQQQVADRVGVDRSRVAQIEVLEKGEHTQKTNTTIATKAMEAGRSLRAQKTIEQVRRVNPELAEQAEAGQVSIAEAKRQAGLIDQLRIAKREFDKCSADEKAQFLAWARND